MGNHCGCGSAYHECGLWSSVLEAFSREKGFNVWENPYALNLGYMSGINIDRKNINTLYKLKWKPMLALQFLEQRFSFPLPSAIVQAYNQGTRNTLELYDQILSSTGKPITVDSTKRYQKAVALYKERPEHVRLIILIRDGRGVYYSNLKRGYSRRVSLSSWQNYYKRALPSFRKQTSPEHVHLVRYEDLVTDPVTTLQGICKFLKIDYVPELQNFRSVVHHNVNGNDVKASSISILKLDNAWETQLSESDDEYFLHSGGTLNSRLGYR
ncbi:MAG: sulfotransferase [Thiobacillaceae bacterium]